MWSATSLAARALAARRGKCNIIAGSPLSPCFGWRWWPAKRRLKGIRTAGGAKTPVNRRPMPTAFARMNSPRHGTDRQVLQPDLGKPRRGVVLLFSFQALDEGHGGVVEKAAPEVSTKGRFPLRR